MQSSKDAFEHAGKLFCLRKLIIRTFAYLAVHGSTLLPSKLMLRSSYLDLCRIGEAGTAFAWVTFFMLFVVGPESACLRMDVPSLADWLIVRRRELIFDITQSHRRYSRSDYATIPHVFRSSDENELLKRRSILSASVSRILVIFAFVTSENFPPSDRASREQRTLSQ